jgi:hypothetical protein
MNRTLIRVCRTLGAIAILCTAAVPKILVADEGLDHLTKEQKAYVDRTRSAIADGHAVVLDAQYLATSGRIGDALVTRKIAMSVVLGEMDGYIGRLVEVASILREPPPTAMRGLIPTNESAASILEGAYASCRGMLVDESVNQTLESGRETLEKLLGGGSGGGGSGLAATARVTSCLLEANGKVSNALAAAGRALSERSEELQKEDELERDLFGDIVGGMCFIATAAYGTASATEIDVLRDFRDDVLLQSPAGRDYVDFYYAASPPLADFIAKHEILRTVVREGVIDPIVAVIRATSHRWRS